MPTINNTHFEIRRTIAVPSYITPVNKLRIIYTHIYIDVRRHKIQGNTCLRFSILYNNCGHT